MNTDWRVIGLEQHDAFMNVALDEACSEAVLARDVPPTIRFYRWLPSAVSIGYFQSMASDVNVENCAAAGVDIVRRQTGGGAVFHDYEGEISYSIIGPVQWFPRGITESYHLICGFIIDALKELGIKSEFKPINDVILSPGSVGVNGEPVGGKKISGNVQTRRNGILLQHGSVLLNSDVRKMFSLLQVETKSENQVISLKNLKSELELMDLYNALLKAFTWNKHYMMGEWTLAELEKARELAENQYATKEWNAMR